MEFYLRGSAAKQTHANISAKVFLTICGHFKEFVLGILAASSVAWCSYCCINQCFYSHLNNSRSWTSFSVPLNSSKYVFFTFSRHLYRVFPLLEYFISLWKLNEFYVYYFSLFLSFIFFLFNHVLCNQIKQTFTFLFLNIEFIVVAI